MCPPFIITQPQNQLVTAGSNASFTVVAAGTPPLRYQWRFKGAAIPDATDATLTVLHVGADDEGEYDVVISNEVGSTTSTPAQILCDWSCNAAHPSAPNPVYLCPGQPFSLPFGHFKVQSYNSAHFGIIPTTTSHSTPEPCR
jgi:hypothetical protein